MDELKKVLNVALAEVGYLEKAGSKNLYSKTENAGNKNFTKYAKELDGIAGFYNTPKQGYAWCDVFVDWCFVKAFGAARAKELLGQPEKSLGAGCPYSAQYFKSMGRYHRTPKAGDQIFFKDSSGKIYHTGIVESVGADTVYTIEGNTSSASGVVANGGAVAKKRYPINDKCIDGYGRPAYRKEEVKVAETKFKDEAKIPKWALEAVKNISKDGIMVGDTDGNFRPNDPITRAEFAVALERYRKNK